jgi:hypothetical protein
MEMSGSASCRNRHIVAGTLAFFLGAACSKTESTPAATSAPAPVRPRTLPKPFPPRPPSKAPAGPAYLAVEGSGVFRIEHGKVVLAAKLPGARQVGLARAGRSGCPPTMESSASIPAVLPSASTLPSGS